MDKHHHNMGANLITSLQAAHGQLAAAAAVAAAHQHQQQQQQQQQHRHNRYPTQQQGHLHHHTGSNLTVSPVNCPTSQQQPSLVSAANAQVAAQFHSGATTQSQQQIIQVAQQQQQLILPSNQYQPHIVQATATIKQDLGFASSTSESHCRPSLDSSAAYHHHVFGIDVNVGGGGGESTESDYEDNMFEDTSLLQTSAANFTSGSGGGGGGGGGGSSSGGMSESCGRWID